MTQRHVRQGQPLVFAGILLGLWLAARIMLWTSPFAAEPVNPPPAPVAQHEPASASGEPVAVAASLRQGGPPWPTVALGPRTSPAVLVAPLTGSLAILAPHTGKAAVQSDTPPPGTPPTDRAAPPGPVRPLYPPLAAAAADSGAARARRWRFDGWIMAREGSGFAGSPSASRLPGYGGSQAGAVLRYRLTPSSARDFHIYARANRALVDGGETDFGIGAGIRPFKAVPLTLLGEVRVTDTSTRTLARPAVLLVGGIPALRVDDRTDVEAYAQAGYVGGGFATPFVDGQARIDRRMARAGDVEWRIGAGVWGGAQQGAARLDIGPSASARFDLGEMPVRLSLDYRKRVAGDAQPVSGLAITIAGGF